jgi:hypothetical protein
MPDGPTLYPALPWSVDALILEALAARLRRDPALQTVLKAVLVVERRAILSQASVPAPVIALSLFADREGRSTSSYGAEQETVFDVALLTPPPTNLEDHGEHLRSRIVARIRSVVRQDGGELTTEDGRTLATAQTTIDRVSFDEAALPSMLVLTVLRLTYRTDISLLTQEILE